jgi:hypothetical protein
MQVQMWKPNTWGVTWQRQFNNSINTTNVRTKRAYEADFAKLMNGPCPIHKDTKHTMWECRGLKMAFIGKTSKKPRCDDDADDNQGGDPSKHLVF